MQKLIDYQPSAEEWGHGNTMQWRLAFSSFIDEGNIINFRCEVAPYFINGEKCKDICIFESFGHCDFWQLAEIKTPICLDLLESIVLGIKNSISQLREEIEQLSKNTNIQ